MYQGNGRIAIGDVRLAIGDVFSGLNPASRTSEKALALMIESIKKYGVIAPIIIDAQGVLIDGHRRLYGARAAGLVDVPYVVAPPDPDGELYPDIQATTRRYSGQEWIERYLAGGNVPKDARQQINRLIRWTGSTAILHRLVAEHLGLHITHSVGALRSYVGAAQDDDEMNLRILNWLIDGRRQFQAAAAIRHRMSPEKMYMHIMTDTNISFG